MLNMDFSEQVVIDTQSQDWQPSPMAGVWRKPLAREEAERGHATSIVKYEAGSFFRSHPHPGGEEILVIKGTFSDETGDYPAGSYFRNPPGTSHAPHSKAGCELLVKLHQFHSADREQVCIDTQAFDTCHTQSQLLHAFQSEKVYWLSLASKENITNLAPFDEMPNAVEILVLSGGVTYGEQALNQGYWFRSHGFQADLLTVNQASVIWCKVGHF